MPSKLGIALVSSSLAIAPASATNFNLTVQPKDGKEAAIILARLDFLIEHCRLTLNEGSTARQTLLTSVLASNSRVERDAERYRLGEELRRYGASATCKAVMAAVGIRENISEQK